MSTTSGGLPLMAQTQSSRYLTYNELAWALNVLQTGVIDRDLTTPPGSPTEGDAYIVASGGTGAWSGQDDSIAFYFGGVWNFLSVDLAQGNGVYVADEGVRVRWEPGSSPPGYVIAGGTPVESVNGLTGAVSLNGGYIGVKGADIASAGTTDLATATGDWVDLTGTTTITALGTVTSGIERLVRFTGILTLTHNGTSLILPTAANITTAAGDFARFRSLGSGNWVCVGYQRASGQALAASTPTQCIPIACSDETTALTTGTAKVTFRMPYAFTLTEVRASVTTAPTGAALIVDINEGDTPTTILSTKITIDATEKTSTTATPPVISDASLADDAQITIDIDQIGSTIAGAGLKVYLIGTKA